MKLPWLMFGILLAMCITVAATMVMEEVPYEEVLSKDGSGDSVQKAPRGHGFQHFQFETMQQGGPGILRHSRILWMGWVYGILMIAVFTACLMLGAKKGDRLGPLRKPLLVGGVLFAVVFTFLILSYRTYMNEDSHSLTLSLPRPTAWMLYGLWVFPVYFVVLYVLTFDRWFLTEEDMKRFQEILSMKRGNEEDDV